VALFGHFNPAICTSDWLAAHDVVTVDEARESLGGLGDPAAMAMNAGDLVFEITLERFLVQTSASSSTQRVAEAIDRVFRVLIHTPIRSLAMGFDLEWSGESPDDRAALLDRFSPVDAWSARVGTVTARSVTARVEGSKDSQSTCHVTVEDSDAYTNGVYASVVEEWEADPGLDLEDGARPALDVLATRWSSFIQRAEEIATTLTSTEVDDG
jgi:hypothetical protein